MTTTPTTYTAADIQAVMQQVATARIALYQDLATDLAAITTKLDAANANMIFADGEPGFISGIRSTVNAYNMSVALVPGYALTPAAPIAPSGTGA